MRFISNFIAIPIWSWASTGFISTNRTNRTNNNIAHRISPSLNSKNRIFFVRSGHYGWMFVVQIIVLQQMRVTVGWLWWCNFKNFGWRNAIERGHGLFTTKNPPSITYLANNTVVAYLITTVIDRVSITSAGNTSIMNQQFRKIQLDETKIKSNSQPSLCGQERKENFLIK